MVYYSCSKSPARSVSCKRKYGADRTASDILCDAEDSEDAYSCIMMGKEAGVLLCSLTDMVKIHQNDRFPLCLAYSRFLGALTRFPGSTFCLDLDKRVKEFSMSNHALNITMLTMNKRPPDNAIV